MPLRILVAAVLLIAALGLGWIAYRAVAPTPTVAHNAEPQVAILVANQALQAGTLLKDADLRIRNFPPNRVPDGGFPATDEGKAEIRGAMLRHYLDPGTPILHSEVLRPRDRGFLAAVLAPGTRAISIAVTAKTSAAGLISPGDFVDVILTQEFGGSQTPIGRRVAAETILSGVRVIAVDQQITQGAPTSKPEAARPIARTVTLQVTPEQAERLAVAERLGQIDLSVRSIDNTATASDGVTVLQPDLAKADQAQPTDARPTASSAPNAAVFSSDVSNALANDASSPSPHVRVIQGGSVNNVIFH